MPKEVRFADEARQRMLAGVNVLAEAVKVDPGAERSQRRSGEKLRCAHRYQRWGIRGKRDRSRRQVREHGCPDGQRGGVPDFGCGRRTARQTATVLAQAVLREGLKAVAAGMDPMDLKRGVDKASVALVKELEKLSQPCEDDKAIAQVGTISANADQEIGSNIAEAMQKVGKEGVITVEEGSALANELEVVEGMQFDRGLFVPLLHQRSTESGGAA
ncbi:MAG: hypothetical protein CM1200mP36_06490 [Gammaproteobacteria bacterium]|nr:MAG: hypothetical protein CM1200mP36_06490 [Gammaproteobacteria bacterium]